MKADLLPMEISFFVRCSGFCPTYSVVFELPHQWQSYSIAEKRTTGHAPSDLQQSAIKGRLVPMESQINVTCGGVCTK